MKQKLRELRDETAWLAERVRLRRSKASMALHAAVRYLTMAVEKMKDE